MLRVGAAGWPFTMGRFEQRRLGDSSLMESNPAPASAQRSSVQRQPRVRSVGLALLASLGIVLCVYVAFPLLAPILWAAVLAIVARPLHRWLERRIDRPSIAAGLGTAAVAIVVALPFALVAVELVLEASEAITQLKGEQAARMWQEFLARHPELAAIVERVGARVDLKELTDEFTAGAAKVVQGLLAGSIASVTGWLIMIFILIFLLRDRIRVFAAIERFLPLSPSERKEVFQVADDAAYATVWGTLGVAVLQGTLGGLVFWWLGLPAPLLWGAVMGVLSVLPVLGAAIVWAPVAGFLALQGNWWDAGVLVAFGVIVIGLADNLVYPMLVKNRIHLHVVPVFVSVIGGLLMFGASGVILGRCCSR